MDNLKILEENNIPYTIKTYRLQAAEKYCGTPHDGDVPQPETHQ